MIPASSPASLEPALAFRHNALPAGAPPGVARDMPVVALAGPLATTRCEPRQARKGAAAAMDSGAGVWRAGAASIPPLPRSSRAGLLFRYDGNRMNFLHRNHVNTAA